MTITTRSIFQKVCPGCMDDVPVDAQACPCGHRFDRDDADSALSSEEIRLRAEELYENYLAARAEQAVKSVKAVQADFVRDPSNQEKSARVATAIEEMQAAEAAWAAQSARIAEMRKLLPPPKPVTSSKPALSMVKKHATAPKAVVTVLPVRSVRKPPTTPAVNEAAAGPIRSRQATKTVVHAVPSKKIVHQIKPKKIEARPVPAPIPARVATPAKKPEAAAAPVQTTTPNQTFRLAQAAKAEKILRATEAAKPVKAAEKQVTPTPPAAVRAQSVDVAPAQGKTAPRLYAVHRKECPNCTATVNNDSNRCRCGYEFSSSEQLIPSLSMSEEERAEFAKLFNLP